MRIFKYSLGNRTGASTTLLAPFGAKFVHVGEQDGEIMVWAAVDTRMPEHSYHLRVVATGEDFSGLHVGTVQIGRYVWHVVLSSELTPAQLEAAGQQVIGL
jgi:hypothetical protein